MEMIYSEYIFLCVLTACCLFLFCSGINPTANGQGGNGTINVNIDNKSYPISYTLSGGEINNMTATKDNPTLAIGLTTDNNGTLVLKLPRDIIDSKGPQNEDNDYAVFADGVPIDANQMSANDKIRTISVDFDKGVGQIEITGTKIVPEFGPLSTLLLGVGMIGVLAVVVKHTKDHSKHS